MPRTYVQDIQGTGHEHCWYLEDTRSFQDMELWECRAVGTMIRSRMCRHAGARCYGDTCSGLWDPGLWTLRAVGTRKAGCHGLFGHEVQDIWGLGQLGC